MAEEAPPLIRHMETYLGPISTGSIFEKPAVQVVRFDDQPFSAAVTYSTLGLSHHVLDQGSTKPVRLELIFACYARYASWEPENLLATVAKDILEKHQALRRGDVLGPAGPIRHGASAHGFYCTGPSFCPVPFAVFEGSEPPTVFVWLLPVTHAEIHHVWTHGWSAFEDLLVERDPDLWDLERSSIVPEGGA